MFKSYLHEEVGISGGGGEVFGGRCLGSLQVAQVHVAGNPAAVALHPLHDRGNQLPHRCRGRVGDHCLLSNDNRAYKLLYYTNYKLLLL